MSLAKGYPFEAVVPSGRPAER